MTTPSPCLTWQAATLHLRNPFRLSYGVSDTRRSFWIRLAGDVGWGEAAIPPYYGIEDAAMIAVWDAAAESTDPFPDEPSAIQDWIARATSQTRMDNPAWLPSDAHGAPAPARCALDLALHDRIARGRGVPLYALLGLPKPEPMPTSFTIAIAEPDEMARLAGEAARFPILKIKLGSDDDAGRLAAVRAARPDALLRVDANAAWPPDEALARVREIERFGLEMIEQPVAKHDFAGMGYVQAHIGLPVVADESVQGLADVEALAAVGVRGINLKLQKVGGLGPGVQIARRARELGMQVLLGCMVETSLGTTAVAHLSGLADWLDLDAPLLISNDPFDGVQYDLRGRVLIPDRAGIGVVRRNEVEEQLQRMRNG